jgi:hypothetical protein
MIANFAKRRSLLQKKGDTRLHVPKARLAALIETARACTSFASRHKRIALT